MSATVWIADEIRPLSLLELRLDDADLEPVLLPDEVFEVPLGDFARPIFEAEPAERPVDIPFDRDDALFLPDDVVLEDVLFLGEELLDVELLDEVPLAFLAVEADFEPEDERDFEVDDLDELDLAGPFFAEPDLDELDFDADDLDFEPEEDEARFDLVPDEADFFPDDFLVPGILISSLY